MSEEAVKAVERACSSCRHISTAHSAGSAWFVCSLSRLPWAIERTRGVCGQKMQNYEPHHSEPRS